MKKRILVLASLILVCTIYLSAQNDMWGTGTSGQILKVDYLEDPFGSTYRLIMEPSILTEYNGNIGIGLSSPTEKLHVDGNISGTNIIGSINTQSIQPAITPNKLTISSNPTQSMLIFQSDGSFSLGEIGDSYVNQQSHFEIVSSQTNEFVSSINNYSSYSGKGLHIFTMGNISNQDIPLSIFHQNNNIFKVLGNGDINFTGQLFQNGSEIKPSRWLEQGNDIYFDSGDVEIDNNLQVGSLTTYGNAAFLSDIGFLQNPGNINFVNQIQGANNLTINGDNDGTDIFISGNGNIGIGNSTPNEKLHISGNIELSGDIIKDGQSFVSSQWEDGTNGIYYNNGGVGIGTYAPSSGLIVDNTGTGPILKLREFGASYNDLYFEAQLSNDENNPITESGDFGIFFDGEGKDSNEDRNISGLVIAPESSTEGGIRIDEEGNVQTIKLWSQEITVDLNRPWSDYVFEENYVLRSLQEVESFINENGHLPEIPSSKKVEKDGINLAEMNALLLMKVEELTLYIIELEKDINELKNN